MVSYTKDKVETFNKRWSEYEQGFSDLDGDKLWYGLKALSCLTEYGQWELSWSHLHYNSSAEQYKVFH